MDVFPCGMCIYSKKCPCRTILAFLALLKKILRLPLWHGTKTERKDYIPGVPNLKRTHLRSRQPGAV
ncbi:hypothetical protein F2Z11_25575 [Bacteroides faecis]|nr:hypothetical protein F2Z11_25575 [Bacteroides faecis]